VNAAFSVNKYMKSHSRAVTMGIGAVILLSTKQKVNARSSTEAELVVRDDTKANILWTKNFIELQGFEVSNSL
jgi:hypothetical protein